MPTAAQQLDRILAALPDAGDRAFVVRHMPAWLRRERRLAERDGAIRQLAVLRHGDLSSGRAVAEALRADLRRATVSAHPGSLHVRVIALSGGRVPSAVTIRRALAGLGTGALADATEAIEAERSRGGSQVPGAASAAVADGVPPAAA